MVGNDQGPGSDTITVILYIRDSNIFDPSACCARVVVTVALPIGVGRFRILRGGGRGGGGPRFRIFGGSRGGQIPSRHMMS